MYKKFREFNKRISVWIGEGLMYKSSDVEFVYEKLPYMWIFILVPIIGILFVVAPLEDREYDRRNVQLKELIKKLKLQ